MRRERNAKNSQATLVLWKWCCDFAEDGLHINFYLFSSPKMKRRKKLTNASQFIFSPVLPPFLPLVLSVQLHILLHLFLHCMRNMCVRMYVKLSSRKRRRKRMALTLAVPFGCLLHMCVCVREKRNKIEIRFQPRETDRDTERERERNENAFILMRGHQIGNRVTCIHFGCGWL